MELCSPAWLTGAPPCTPCTSRGFPHRENDGKLISQTIAVYPYNIVYPIVYLYCWILYSTVFLLYYGYIVTMFYLGVFLLPEFAIDCTSCQNPLYCQNGAQIHYITTNILSHNQTSLFPL